MSTPANKSRPRAAIDRIRRVEAKRPRRPRVTAELAEDNSPAVIALLADALDILTGREPG